MGAAPWFLLWSSRGTGSCGSNSRSTDSRLLSTTPTSTSTTTSSSWSDDGGAILAPFVTAVAVTSVAVVAIWWSSSSRLSRTKATVTATGTASISSSTTGDDNHMEGGGGDGRLDWDGWVIPFAQQFVAPLVTNSSVDVSKQRDEQHQKQQQQPLLGRVVVITGCTSGIGYALAIVLARLGATIVGVSRSASKLALLESDLVAARSLSTTCANSSSSMSTDSPSETAVQTAVTTSPACHKMVVANLEDLDSVAAASNEIIQSFPIIDVLINNAGIHDGFSNIFGTKTNPQGYDMVFVVNYLSHVLLTEKLLPCLLKSKVPRPTIVQISSSFHYAVDGSDLRMSSSTATTTSYNNESSNDTTPRTDSIKVNTQQKVQASWPIAARPGGSRGYYFMRSVRSYANSKLAQIYHARALVQTHQQQQQSGSTSSSSSTEGLLRVVSICPGWVATGLGGPIGHPMRAIMQLGFQPMDWGIASALYGMFNITNPFDFYTNATIFNEFQTFNKMILQPSWMYQFAIRDSITFVAGLVLMPLQHFYAQVSGTLSSIESYDTVIAMELYQWSLTAIAEYLQKS